MTALSEIPAIEHLVPHGGRMVLLDEILAFTDDSITSRVVINKQTEFVLGNGVPVWVGLEYMAQTISALSGLRRRKKDQPPELGFLLGARKYQCHCQEFPVGSELTINMQIVHFDEGGLGSYHCEIWMNDEIAAEATLTAFEPDDVDAYLS